MAKRIRLRKVPATTNNLTKGIINYINTNGGFAFRVNVTGIPGPTGWRRSNSKGVSDILCVYNGRFIAIEVKNAITRDRMRKDQQTFREFVETNKGIYIIARDMVGAQQQFENAKRSIDKINQL